MRFDSILSAIMRFLVIDESHRQLVKARMRNFQRIGFAPSSGRGRRGHDFSERDAFELFLASVLNLQGMPPEHAAYLITRKRATIHKTAESNRILIFHPEGAVTHQRCQTLTEVWNLGLMRQALTTVEEAA